MKKHKEIMLYQAKDGAIAFRGDFESDTVWGTQKQIAEVFGIERSVVTKHIRNILSDGEVDKNSTCAKFAHVQMEGGREVVRNVEFYNLDIILAVGYRTNSAKAMNFRKWATKVLKQHLTKGYTINKNLVAKNYDAFMKAVGDVQKLLPKENDIPTETILELIKSFADTWFSLESYDEDRLPQKGFSKRDLEIQSDELYAAVAKFKSELIKKKEATDLFAQEKKFGNLEGILGNVMQSAFGRDVYESVEEKAAHLLYFVVKNHPFNDGNKRTGAFSFVWFLNKAGIPYKNKITPEALTAITLLVAESKAKEKERIIGLILLMLKR